jgi:uncharacterized membrane protein
MSAEQLAQIASFGVPVYTIGVGRQTMPEDLEVSGVLVPTTALPGGKISARISIRHDRGGSARIRVYDGDDLVRAETVELSGDARLSMRQIDFELADSGLHRLSFSVDSAEDEPERRNNRRTALVDVADEAWSVLYYEGEPRWEYKFMRRAVHDDEQLRLATLLRVSQNKFYRQGLDSPDELAEGFPTTREALFAYDAIIIGSVESASFSTAQQELIADFVSERGGGLLLIAGNNGLGNGGWGQSRIADVLPTRLPPPTDNTFVRERTRSHLTPEGQDTAMLQLADGASENREAWEGLPEIADLQALGQLKPAAITLLEVERDSGRQPLLVTQHYGRGQSYLLGTGGTWRWQMSLPADDLRHETFWRQFLRALVATVPQKQSLTAATSGSALRLRAEFRDDAFQPVDGIRVTAMLSHEDGESMSLELPPSATEAGVFEAEIESAATGTWYVEAVARRGEEEFGVLRTTTWTESERAEFFDIRASDTLLRRISQATGGAYFDADDAAGIGDRLRYSGAGITEVIRRPLWDAPAFFLLLLLLKTGEWLLRRRWRSI